MHKTIVVSPSLASCLTLTSYNNSKPMHTSTDLIAMPYTSLYIFMKIVAVASYMLVA